MPHSFFGGVFPATRKESTRRKPLNSLSVSPEELVIPLLMCADGPSLPLVRPGDRVLRGQPVAQWEETGGAAAHSGISGRVTALEDRPHPWGGSSPAIIIRNDGQDTPWDGRPEPLPLREANLTSLMERVQGAGIVGMGGAAYPAWKKLDQAAGRVDTLIINAAECEPYVTADHRLLLERAKYIIQGGELLARCLGASHVVLVTEGDKLNAVESLERRLRRNKLVRLCTVRTRYPLGAEKQIVQTVTGREVPPGGSPLDVKCVVFNVATVYAIQDAFFRGHPLTHRAVTVTGGAVTRPRNLWVPIGTPWRVLLEACGGLREEAELMVTGGPMMGVALPSLDAPVLKSTNSLVCLTSPERKSEGAGSVCIRCGKCVDRCPMHLAPTFIRQALKANDLAALAKLHPEDCNACGCCSFICPAQIPLVETVTLAKNTLREGGTAQ
ncbi:electron transport complex subunit RsxC [Lawsonibacter sp. LCP25S3_G6]|uniref:electron transport complex subunit RsxC n=1 Tax=unclassified Lawsonibacter TaxID=2617946 RepID=UPI003F9AEA00